MPKPSLGDTIAATIDQMRLEATAPEVQPVAATSVLERMGVELAPTLEIDGPLRRLGDSEDRPDAVGRFEVLAEIGYDGLDLLPADGEAVLGR